METKRGMPIGIVLTIVLALICSLAYKRAAVRHSHASRIQSMNAAPKVVFTLATPTNLPPNSRYPLRGNLGL